jgi:tyrosine-protein kinase Etk/Wzc
MIPLSKVKEVTLKDYFDIVRRRAGIVTIFVIAAACYGIFSVLAVPKTYRAEATIAVSQRVLLHSRSVAERVIKSLDLKESPKKLLATVKVAPRRGSNVVGIAVTGRDPVKISNIANMWVKESITLIMDRDRASTRESAAHLEEQLSEVSKELLDSEMALNNFTKKHEAVARGGERIKNLERQALQVETDMQTFSTKYGPDHPRMTFLDSQLEALNSRLAAERDSLSAAKDLMAKYRTLKEKVDAQKNIYKGLSQRIQRMQASVRLIKSDVQAIDKAQPPKEPLSSKGKIPKMIMTGLLLGIVACFVLEHIDTTLKQAEEVEFYAKMPFLGYVPSVRKIIKSGKELNLFSHLKPDSRVAEAFRNVKVALIFASPENKDMKTVMVTSAVDGEGKSFAASNLAISFARAKEKTLLIDGDMKQGSLMGSFEVKKRCGLSDLLDGKCGLNEAISPTQVPDLSFMCAGTYTPGSTDLLSQEKFGAFFEEIKSKFQRIVIDVPSVLKFNDVLFWGNKCDGAVNVIGAGVTPLKDIYAAAKKMEGKANIIGAVLNNISIERDFNYYRHYFQSFLEKELGYGKLRELKRIGKHIKGGKDE